MSNVQNFTIAYLDSLKPADKGTRYTIYDGVRPELGLRVTDTGNKSFFVMKKIRGSNRVVRDTLGRYPVMTISQAREAAIETVRAISKGVNPNDEKKRFRQEATLGELFKEFMERYSKLEKKSWIYDQREIPKFYDTWFARKISDITKQQIQKRHEEIKANHGLYQANRSLERLRVMYNKAIEWGWDGTNPTNGIKKYKEIKRDRFLLVHEVSSFFNAVNEEDSLIHDYIWLSLMTGARKSNVLAMRWSEIDFNASLWRIPDTKNGEPVIIPLIPRAVNMLNERYNQRKTEWVFDSPTKPGAHFVDPKKAWGRILERAGIEDLRIHDIRRTLGSWQAMTGASLSVIGKSLGHKSTEATNIYARLQNDTVRDSIQVTVDKLLECK